jgi:hypothetical protein
VGVAGPYLEFKDESERVIENSLLASLPLATSRRLLAILEPVQLVLRDVLYEPGQVIRQVFFRPHRS